MLICIEHWKYLMFRQADGQFRVWHHVTPADAGYGTEVEVHLPGDYFRNHSVKKFYEYIAGQQHCHPGSCDKQAEIKTLKAQLTEAGWLD